MAIEETKEGRQLRYGYNEANSATFGTAAGDADTYTQVACEHFDIEPDLKGHDIPGSFGTRQPQYMGTHTNTKGSMPDFNVKGVVSNNEIAQFAYAHFQKVVEGAATPFTKVFTPFATLPDFSASAGHWLTWAVGYPVVTTSHKAEGCICNRFKISCNRNEFMMFDTGWKAHGVPAIDSAVYESGTWELGLIAPGGVSGKATDYGRLAFNDIDLAFLDFDDDVSPSADIITLQSFEIESEYAIVEGIKPSGAGSFQTYGLANWGGTFRIELLKDSQVEAALANVKANSGIRFQVNWGAAGALVAGEFESIMYGKISPDGIAFDKDGLIGAVLSGTIAGPDTTTDAWKVTHSDTIDHTW